MSKKMWIIITIIVIICLLLMFIPGLIVKYAIERPLEDLVGAKVELHAFRFNLLKLGTDIGGLEIANPKNTWRNLVETGAIRFHIEPLPLLSGKIVVEEVVIDEMRIDTLRKTDGKLDRPIPPMSLAAAISNLEQQIPPVPVLDLNALGQELNPDRVINAFRFTMDTTADTIQANISTKQSQFEASLSGPGNIKEKIDSLRSSYNEIKSFNWDLQRKIDSLKNLKNKVSPVQDLIGSKKTEITNGMSAFKSDITNLSGQATADLNTLLASIHLPNLDTDLNKALFGKLLLDRSVPFLELLDRLRGFKFYSVNPDLQLEKPKFPRLLVKHIGISAGNPDTAQNGYGASGAVDNITNEPAACGQPLTASITGNAPNSSTLGLNLSLNHITAAYDDSFGLKLQNIKLPQEPPWANNPYLPPVVTVDSLNMEGSLNLTPESFVIDLNFSAQNIRGNYPSGLPTDEVMRIIRDTLGQLDQLTLGLRLQGRDRDISMRVSSDIASTIIRSIQRKLNGQVQRFIIDVTSRVNQRLSGKQDQLKTFRDKSEKTVLDTVDGMKGRLDGIKGDIESLISELESKLPPKPSEPKWPW